MSNKRPSVFARAVCACGMLTVTASVACSPGAAGQARMPVAPPSSRWVGPEKVPLVVESNESARDLAALLAVVRFWGRSSQEVATLLPVGQRSPSDEPLSTSDLERFARAAGLTAFAFHGMLEDVLFELRAGRPVIVGVNAGSDRPERRHFEVVIGCDADARRLRSFDPARGLVERSYASFQSDWQLSQQLTLVMFDADEATVELAASGKTTSLGLERSVEGQPSRGVELPDRRGASPSPRVAQR